MTVAAALRNVRRTVGAGLAAPLDARPSDGAPRGSVDSVLAATVTALVGFGIVMVYTASAVLATVQYRDPQFFLKRQCAYSAAGLAVMWVVRYVDYHRLYKMTYPLLGVVGLLLVACVT